MYSLHTEYAARGQYAHVHSGDHTNAINILYYHSSLFKDRFGTTKPAA